MRSTLCITTVVLATLLLPTLTRAQVPLQSDTLEPSVGTTLPADVIRDLPLADSVYAALETTQAELIADRFNSGGLNVAGDARVGGFLGSWSQTLFRVGDINVSDPSGSGASLLFPSLLFWERVRVTTGLMPGNMNTPGLGVTLQPLRPGGRWMRSVSASGSGDSLVAEAPVGEPPPIVRLHDYGTGSVVVSGPLSSNAGLVAAATFSRGSHYARELLADTHERLASTFAHVVFDPSTTREIRVLTWLQHSTTPQNDWAAFREPSATSDTTALHVQSTLEDIGAHRWRVFGGFTGRTRTHDLGSVPAVAGLPRAGIERITEGPVPQFVDRATDTQDRRVAFGGRFGPVTTGNQRIELGADGEMTSVDTSNPFTGVVSELVNGLPARLWTYSSPGADRRTTSTVSAFASDTLRLGPVLTLDAGVRLDAVHGSARGAPTSISWVTPLPHAMVQLGLGANRTLRFGYARTANRLTMDWLAYGDPSAVTATVANAAVPGVVVSRVGPGTGGNDAFSRIDPDVKRPTTDEFVIGYERRRGANTRYTLTAIARRETHMLGVVNTGVPASAYAAFTVADPGADWASAADDRPLVVYNRPPATFGHDAYLLTTPDQEAANAYALRMTWEHTSRRWFMLFGATASAATGQGSNRGYGPLENDQDQPGELFTNPNGATYARGRLFADRAFTIKWTATYHLPWGVTAGGIARYQDGQPFSRLVVVPVLDQGTEAVQAYARGDSRFTFTSSLDLRLQKRFSMGAVNVDAIFDAYDLFTRSNEVEEFVVSDPVKFRQPTAIEPPPSLHVGVRVVF